MVRSSVVWDRVGSRLQVDAAKVRSMRGVRVVLVLALTAGLFGLGVVPASARASLSDTAAEGLDILAGVVDGSGIEPVTGGATSSAAVSDVTETGLVVSLPKSADGIVWMDDPYGYDLGLGMPTSGGRSELYCPMDGWYRQDDMCLYRVGFRWVFAKFEYDYQDYEYDYLDYTYQEQDYGYAYQTPSTHPEVEEWDEFDPMGGGQHEPPCEEGEGQSYAQWANGGQGGPVCNVPGWVTRTQVVQVNDEPPVGWEFNDDESLWRQMLPVPAG